MFKRFRVLFYMLSVSFTTNASIISFDKVESLPYKVVDEKILFIGNSFTFYWNLPSQVEEMSKEKGLNWDVMQFSVPSATLKDHWNNPELKRILKNQTFDHIIIQEHSTNILTGEQGSTKDYFNLILTLIPDSTQVHFFSTWMYPSMNHYNINKSEYPIEDKVKELISGTTHKFIPVGRAFKLFNFKHSQFNLLLEDNKHPNPNGSYLASCVIFSHLSGQSSLNLSKRYNGKDSKGVDIYYSIVEDEVLTFLQQISDDIISL